MTQLMKKLEQGWRQIADLLDPKVRAEKQLLEVLLRDYEEEKVIAEAIARESERIPYSHLRKKLLDIAEAEKAHAEQLRQTIESLGGRVPESARSLKARRDGGEATSTLDLLKILEEEKQEYVEYLDARGLAREAERPDVLELLETIREEEARHRRELLDILTKLNPIPRS